MDYYAHVNYRPFRILAERTQHLAEPIHTWTLGEERESPSTASPMDTRAVPGAFCHASNTDTCSLFLYLQICSLQSIWSRFVIQVGRIFAVNRALRRERMRRPHSSAGSSGKSGPGRPAAPRSPEPPLHLALSRSAPCPHLGCSRESLLQAPLLPVSHPTAHR